MQHPMTAILKPATPGLRVTFPGTRDALPAEGASVELSNYWRERIREGSVVLVEPKSAEPSAETSQKGAPRANKNKA